MMTTTTRSLAALLTSLSVLVVPATALALEGTLTAEGTKTAKFASEKFTAIKYEVKSPRDIATGQASGKRQHSPICVYRATTQTSPQYFQALITNETLKNVTLEVSNGMKLKLTNATVSNYSLVGGVEGKDLEELCFTFQHVEFSVKGGAPVVDDTAR